MNTLIAKLKQCAATINEVVDVLAQKDEPKTAEVALPTLEEVRAVLVSLSRNGKTAEVKAILTKHGVNKLSEVNPADYADVLKEAEALNG